MKSIIMICAVFLLGYSAHAQIPPVDNNGLAIGGYDVVSYFSGKPTRGFDSFSSKYKGVTYYFFTKSNKAAFHKSPEKFLPQFDGFCAWGVGAKSAKFPIDPESYDIVDGKLYLFYNAPLNGKRFNTILDWNSRTTELRKVAYANWPKVKNSK